MSAEVEVPVEYKNLNALFADYARNFSRPWTIIRTENPFDVGTVLRFRLNAPRLPEPIYLQGSVEERHADGMRVGFFYRTPEERRANEQRIRQLMTDSLGPVLSSLLLAPASSDR